MAGADLCAGSWSDLDHALAEVGEPGSTALEPSLAAQASATSAFVLWLAGRESGRIERPKRRSPTLTEEADGSLGASQALAVCPVFESKVAQYPGRADREEQGHRDCAGYAPLANRLDNPEFKICEVEAEAETEHGKRKRCQAPAITPPKRGGENRGVADQPVDRDVNSEQHRVLALLNGGATGAAAHALRNTAGSDREAHRARNPKANQAEDYGCDPEVFFFRHDLLSFLP